MFDKKTQSGIYGVKIYYNYNRKKYTCVQNEKKLFAQ